eukprot:1158606-Pelagomonas_calceolata.AAC.1
MSHQALTTVLPAFPRVLQRCTHTRTHTHAYTHLQLHARGQALQHARPRLVHQLHAQGGIALGLDVVVNAAQQQGQQRKRISLGSCVISSERVCTDPSQCTQRSLVPGSFSMCPPPSIHDEKRVRGLCSAACTYMCKMMNV